MILLGFIVWYLVGIISIFYALKWNTIAGVACDLYSINYGDKVMCVLFGFFGFINIFIALFEYIGNYDNIKRYYEYKRRPKKLTLKQLRTKKLKIIKKKSRFRWL